MSCLHKRIKSENCVISCMECGAILPIDYIVAKERMAAQGAEAPAPEAADDETPAEAPEAAKTPAKGQKKTTGKKVGKHG